MTIKAINNLTPDWYTTKDEEGTDSPTRFKIKPLDGLEYMDVMMETGANPEGDLSLTGKGMRTALKYGLVGWENLSEPSGPIAFSHASFGKIPVNILTELAGEILNRSNAHMDKTD